jgi:hypothetical protein
MDFGGGYGRGRGGGPPPGRGRGGGRGYRERSFSPPPQRRSPDYGRYSLGYGRGGGRFARRDGDYRCGRFSVSPPHLSVSRIVLKKVINLRNQHISRILAFEAASTILVTCASTSSLPKLSHACTQSRCSHGRKASAYVLNVKTMWW